MVLFHATKTATTSIKVGDVTINSQKSIKVLGIVFDEHLDWNQHIESAIKKTKTANYGLKRIIRYVSTEEAKKVAMACVYSVLYYGAQIYLHPGLKQSQFKRLLSTSSLIIRTCFGLKYWNLVSFNDLHQIADILTPQNTAKYLSGLMLYDYKTYPGEQKSTVRDH